jgi:predicted phage terminase large subunit-like protein
MLINVIEDIRRAKIAEKSYYEFSKQAWKTVEWSTPLIENWHMPVLCEHLEAVYRREIRNLLINIPPMMSKTSFVSIFFLPWVWLQNPEERFMYASYNASLSLDDSVKCRRVIESEWYQGNWGEKVTLQRDQNAKGIFENTYGGFRKATSVKIPPTGRHVNFLICDDPNNLKDGESEATRHSVNRWWTQEWQSRLNDPQKDVKIVVQQRLHSKDVSGTILDSEQSEEWTQVILPMEFEKSRRSTTIALPGTNGKVWQDPRTIDGELLFPKRFDEQFVSSMKASLGSYGYAGQYQQRPSPKEGGIIKVEYFKPWKYSSPPDLFMRLQSWDTALTANEESSYSACTTWGLFFDQNRIYHVILLGLWRGKLEYPELRDMAKRLYFDYKDNGAIKKEHPTHRPIDVCLVEAKASGSPLIQDFRRAGIVATPFIPNPKKHGDKIERVKLVMPTVRSGVVWLPCQGENFNLTPFAQDFLEHMRMFPKDDSMDVVDTMTQVLIWLKSGEYLKNLSDDESLFDDTPKKPKKRVY